MWVDPHPRRVGTKIMRVPPQVDIKMKRCFAPIFAVAFMNNS